MAGKKGGQDTKAEVKSLTRKVQFEFLSPEAKEVSLVGEFNNWDTNTNLLEKDKDGMWKTMLSLKPGRYQYRYLVDGIWMNDISCSGCIPNEFGSQNCVKVIE